MTIKYLMGLCLLSVCYLAHAQNFLPIRHVIVNTTKDIMSYDFHFQGDPSCDSNDSISIAHMKQVDCKSGALFKPGMYTLNFEQVYFYGKRKVLRNNSNRLC